MSEQVTIQEVQDARDWSSPDNKIHNTFYQVVIKKADGTEEEVDHARQQGKPEPQPGEELTVIFEPGKYRRRMKKDQSAFTPGGSSRPSESSTGTKSGGEVDWDAKEARITRQAVLKVLAPSINKEGALTVNIKAVVEDIEQFVSEAPSRPLGQKASQGAVPTTSSPQESSPHGAAPDSPPADDTGQWLENLLIQGGAPSYGAGKLASFATEEFSPENLKKCEALLSNLDTQVEGRQRLETSYTKAKGEPVPQEDPDSDPIPF